MTQHDALQAALTIVGCWGLFFVFLATVDTLDIFRYLGIIADTLVFLIIEWVSLKKELMSESYEIVFWTVIVFDLINVIIAFYFATIALSIFYIDNVPVVTFFNLFSFVYYAIGLFFLRDIVNRFIESRKRISAT